MVNSGRPARGALPLGERFPESVATEQIVVSAHRADEGFGQRVEPPLFVVQPFDRPGQETVHVATGVRLVTKDVKRGESVDHFPITHLLRTQSPSRRLDETLL